jgi:hypothetical protein
MLEFPYVSFEVTPAPNSKRKKTVWRPVVEIIVFRNKMFAAYPVLIDSGADYNIFHGDLFTALGGKLTSGRKRRIVGLGDQPLKGYEHKIELKLPGGLKYTTQAIFSNQIPDHAFGVLGQEGFFDQHKVTFQYGKKIVSIS